MVTPETIFQVCSVSKPVAAVLALLLVQDGLLDLDEPVNAYLTFCFGHGGDSPGYKCLVMAMRERPVGLVVMTNGDHGKWLCDELFRAITQEYQWWSGSLMGKASTSSWRASLQHLSWYLKHLAVQLFY